MAGTAGLRRDERAGAPPIELDAQPIIVEGLVAEQSVECDSLDQWFDPDAVVALAGQKNEAYEIAERLDHCDDLGGQATSRPANGLISSLPFAPMPCWWARTIVPSMIVYSKSRSLDKASKRLSNTPFKGPAAEAPEDRIPKPEWVGKIAPGCTRAGDPEHGFEEAPVVGRRSSWVPGLAGKEGSNPLPLRVLQHFANQG